MSCQFLKNDWYICWIEKRKKSVFWADLVKTFVKNWPFLIKYVQQSVNSDKNIIWFLPSNSKKIYRMNKLRRHESCWWWTVNIIVREHATDLTEVDLGALKLSVRYILRFFFFSLFVVRHINEIRVSCALFFFQRSFFFFSMFLNSQVFRVYTATELFFTYCLKTGRTFCCEMQKWTECKTAKKLRRKQKQQAEMQ